MGREPRREDRRFTSASTPWSPSQLTNLAGLWLSDVGVTEGGGTATAWANQVAGQPSLVNNGTINYSASDSEFGNRPAFAFPNADSCWKNSGTWSPNFTSPWSIFVVGRFASAPIADFYGMWGAQTTSTPEAYFSGPAGALTVASPTGYTTPSAPLLVPCVMSAVYNGASSGIAISKRSFTTTGTCGAAFSYNSLVIGGIRQTVASSTFGCRGKIVAAGVVRGAFSSVDLDNIAVWASSRYGITVAP